MMYMVRRYCVTKKNSGSFNERKAAQGGRAVRR